MRYRNQKGQAVLIVLLSLSVVLIVVLFILSRSVTDVSLSSKSEESLRAFSAAEAGVERALVSGAGTGGPVAIGDATVNATVSTFAANSSYVPFPISLKSGEYGSFWFARTGSVTSYTGSQLKFCWGDPSTPQNGADTPAIEVTVYYTTTPNDLTTLRTARALLDPNSSRLASNNAGQASVAACTLPNGTDTYAFQSTMNVGVGGLGIAGYATPGVMQYATVRMLYNTTIAHKVGLDVTGLGVLPSQGTIVTSDGTYGDSNRSVEVYQLNAEIPPVFANAIFSSNGINK